MASFLKPLTLYLSWFFADVMFRGHCHAESSDDLPLWGFVGELHPDKNSENGKHVLYTHRKTFSFFIFFRLLCMPSFLSSS
ncbi:hypothetical protein SLA2020_053250 [Shorea laevis]